MKIKLLMLALCFSLILAFTSCNKVKPGPVSGCMRLDVSDTFVYFYHTNAFSKNKKQEIILAYWHNIPKSGEFDSSSLRIGDSTSTTCFLTKSNPTVKLKCVGKLYGKTGKGTVNIAGKDFDVSSGRLFLIDTHEKPLKVIQVNEQFNLPPFNHLSSLDNPFFNERSFKNAIRSCEKKFEYLAKNNKIVAAFLADSKKSTDSSQNKSKDLKKD